MSTFVVTLILVVAAAALLAGLSFVGNPKPATRSTIAVRGRKGRPVNAPVAYQPLPWWQRTISGVGLVVIAVGLGIVAAILISTLVTFGALRLEGFVGK